MPFIAAPIKLTEKTKNILNQYAKSRTLPMNQIQRAKIVLESSKGKNNREISNEVKLSQDIVSKWRTRWVKNAEQINNVEENDPEKLEEAIETYLKDLPRPGCPCDFTEQQILRILETACRPPSEFGYETSHWSLTQLAKAVMAEGIAGTISPASIGRFLKYGQYTAPSRTVLAAFNR